MVSLAIVSWSPCTAIDNFNVFAKTSCESVADRPADARVYNPSEAVPKDIPYCVPNLTISSERLNKTSLVV